MTDEVRQRVFEPFFTTKERGKGTGLGLATVFGVVRQAGGAVTVDSAPGKGSRFSVLLPASDESATAVSAREPKTTRRQVGTILVAEDLAPVLSLTCRILEQRGYRILAARDGQEALALAEAHAGTIDLLVTDLIMPGMSGRVLAERLREMRPGLPTLFVSGQVEEADAADGQVFGGAGTAFLPKPFTADDLFEHVRQMIEGGRRGA
jgi:CheY-like chemotaxis protein